MNNPKVSVGKYTATIGTAIHIPVEAGIFHWLCQIAFGSVCRLSGDEDDADVFDVDCGVLEGYVDDIGNLGVGYKPDPEVEEMLRAVCALRASVIQFYIGKE
jgi:hypothetical protein